MRLDKWLWVARFAKTRTKSAELCSSGKIKVNGTSVKPAKTVTFGDRLTLRQNGIIRSFEILDMAPRRLAATHAAALYMETTPVKKAKEIDALLKIAEEMERRSPPPKGRPTKKNRRQINKFRQYSKE